LIVTVDCGVSNNQEIAFAASLGLKVAVTDHHQVDEFFTPFARWSIRTARLFFPFQASDRRGLAFSWP